MKTSDAGITLVKSSEGLKLVAYKCPAGIWTNGYGHTGPDVTPGQVITQAQADALLARDLERFEAGVARLVKVPLNQNQFDALVCFSFNLGLGALQGSTLLRLLNAGDYAGAAAQFPRWNKAGGKELPGLTRRRAAEQSLFQAA
ncbi:lysozyme [Chromobacterium haemolyticum]|uniref:Lysozyme n=1 Tax=Chromobacterium fluminis TaxID=3044269 RepID=A0ABX0L437_9NEIS|nr:lysozyme [Chromobacterium haemolyticum]NHR05723.1 lysozyme [Chromobacterium haemolyticum]